MKKVVRILFLTLVVTALCLTAAWAAAPETGGIHTITKETSVTLTIKGETGTEITGTSASVTGGEVSDFHAGAVQMDLSYTGTANTEYMVLVLGAKDDTVPDTPTEENIVYMNQAAADGTGALSMTNIYPSALKNGYTYGVYVVAGGVSDTGALTSVATFKYYAPYVLGDVSGDDEVTAEDLPLLVQHVVKNATLEGDRLAAADVNEDGAVNGLDIMKLVNHLVGNAPLN